MNLSSTQAATKKQISFFSASLYSLVLAVYFLCAPFEDLLTSSIGSLAKFLGVAAVASMLLYYLYGSYGRYKDNLKVDFRTSHFILVLQPLILVILAWVSYLWAYDSEVTFSRNITYTLLPLLFILIYTVSFEDFEFEFIKTCAIIGGVLAALYLINKLGWTQIFSNRLMLTEENDPNNFAALLITPAALCLERFMHSKTRLKKVLYLACLLLVSFMLLLTGSRGGMIALAVFIVLYLVLSFAQAPTKKNLVTLLVIVLVFLLIITFLPEAIAQRLFEADSYNRLIESEGNRVVLWRRIATEIVPTMPFSGFGSGNNITVLSELFGAKKGVHNTYISLFLEYGILGLSLFLWFIVSLLRRVYNKKGYLEFALVIALLAVIFFLDAYAKKFFWNTLFLAAIFLKTKSSKEEAGSING